MTGQLGTGPTPEHDADCANALSKLYEFLDQELEVADADDIRHHLVACEPCLDAYDAETALRQLIKRGCGGEHAPDHLKAKVLSVLERTVTVRDGVTVETQTTIEIRES